MPERHPWDPWWVIIGVLALGWLVIIVGMVIHGKAPGDIAIGALVSIPATICGVIIKLRRKNGD